MQVTRWLTCYLVCVRVHSSIQSVVHGADCPRLHTHTCTHINNKTTRVYQTLFIKADGCFLMLMCHTFHDHLRQQQANQCSTLQIQIKVICFQQSHLIYYSTYNIILYYRKGPFLMMYLKKMCQNFLLKY